MAWQDRLREAAYRSPGGTRTVFTYEDVSKQFDKKTAPFEFADADGTYIQDLGATGERIPLRVIFWGPDYDLQIEAFWETLKERGIGILEHPMYGAVDVVPSGTVTRRDDLKREANQGIIEVSFAQSITLFYPSTRPDPQTIVGDTLLNASEGAAEEFADTVSPSSASLLAALRARLEAQIARVKRRADRLAEYDTAAQAAYDAIEHEIRQRLRDLF